MRLSEITKVDSQFDQQFKITIFKTSDHESRMVLKLNELISSDIKQCHSIYFTAQENNLVFKWPANLHLQSDLFSMSCDDRKHNLIIENFEFPNNFEHILCDGAIVKSLSGIEKLSKMHALSFVNRFRFNCGLLRFLKVSDPKELNLSFDDFSNRITKFKDAADIVCKHMYEGDADILECQNELIDAGLEKYAKL